MSGRLKDAVRSVVDRAGYHIVSTRSGSPEHLDPLSLSAHLRELFRDLRTDCVFDVGGNRGQFPHSLRADVGYRGRIVSFEPVPAAYAALVKTMAADGGWSGRQLALGTQQGTALITVFAQDNFSSFLSPSEYGERQFPALANAGTGEGVTVRRLDDEWPDATSGSGSVFLKLDTQGRDLDVLASGSGVLSHVQGLLTEIPVDEIYADMCLSPIRSGSCRTSTSQCWGSGRRPRARSARERVPTACCAERRQMTGTTVG